MTSAIGSRGLRPQAGQTLLEMLLVLALMVLVLGVAVATVAGGRARPPADAALDGVAAMLQQVRRAAVSEGRTLTLHWEAGHRTLAWRERSLTLSDTANLRLGPPSDQEPQAALLDIAFRPDGSCDPFIVMLGGGGPGARRWRVDPWTARLALQEKAP